MTKEELIKELELLADSCDSNYALEMNGYNRGVLDALSVVNKYFALADVSGRSELLKAFLKWYDLSPEENASKTHSALIRGFKAFNSH